MASRNAAAALKAMPYNALPTTAFIDSNSSVTSIALGERVTTNQINAIEEDSRPNKAMRYLERFNAVKNWYIAFGVVRFILSLVGIILVPTLLHHYTVNIRVSLYTVVNSWTYDLFYVIAVCGLLTGLLYLLCAVPVFWEMVRSYALVDKINGYSHLVDAIESALLILVISQVVGITDVFFLVLIAVSRLAASFYLYSMDIDNTDVLNFPDGIIHWHNGIFSALVLVCGAWLPIFAHAIPYNTYLNGLDPLLFTDYYRAWFVLTLFIVAAFVDVFFNTFLNFFRYGHPMRNEQGVIYNKDGDWVYENFITDAFVKDPSRYEVVKAGARLAVFLLTLVSMFTIAIMGH